MNKEKKNDTVCENEEKIVTYDDILKAVIEYDGEVNGSKE